jgi:hypothetical protein
MTTVKLSISSKNLNSHVNYHKPKKTYAITNNNKEQTKTDFLEQTKKKGEISQKQKEILKKIAKITLMSGMVFLTSTHPTFAAAAVPVATAQEVDIMNMGKYLITATTALGVVAAIVAYQFAGGLRIFRKGEVANKWSADIKKGFIQILTAPFLFALLHVVVQYFLGGFDWFSMIK